MYLLAILGGTVGVVLCSILSGYAISVSWGWFVVPTFGLAPLSLPVAIGLSGLVNYFTYRVQYLKDAPEIDVMKTVAYCIAKPLALLFVGYIVKQFI